MAKRHRHEPKNASGGWPPDSAATGKKIVAVFFDLEDENQAEALDRHRSAFGESYTQSEPLGGGKAVLKIRPGGAKELR